MEMNIDPGLTEEGKQIVQERTCRNRKNRGQNPETAPSGSKPHNVYVDLSERYKHSSTDWAPSHKSEEEGFTRLFPARLGAENIGQSHPGSQAPRNHMKFKPMNWLA